MTTETVYTQRIEFLSSEILESKREVDYYEYPIRYGKIYSKITGRPVEESIVARTGIEKAERMGFNQIQIWAVYSDEGSCAWISPPARTDLSAKAVISEIKFDPEYGKILTNRNICFDWEEDLFMRFAEGCKRFDIKNGEDLRGKPIFLTPESKYKLYALIEKLEPSQIEHVRTGEDIKNKERLKTKLANGVPVAKGSRPLSCLGSAFTVFSGEAKWCEKCPVCGKEIKDFIKVGYKCGGCGETKKC